MLRLTTGIIAFSLFALLALSACGDDNEASDITLEDTAALADLDSQQQALLCEALIDDSPVECWQESNYPSGSFKLKSDDVEDESAVCLDILAQLASSATVAEIKACFAAQDDACELSGSACNNVVAANYW